MKYDPDLSLAVYKKIATDAATEQALEDACFRANDVNKEQTCIMIR